MRIACALLFLGLAGCRRGDAAAPSSDGGLEAAITMDAAVTMPAPEPSAIAPDTRTEARRVRVTKPEDLAALRPNAALVREHFGGAPLDVQIAALANGMRAVLMGADADDPKPLVLVVDAGGAVVWKKDHPVAGVIPKVKEMAIAARPMGGVVLFLYDEPTHIVAARLWDADGSPFADLQLFEIDRCDALSAVRWPGRGWVVVAARPGGARAQLLRESGVTAWGEHGTPVGAAWRAMAPASLAVEKDAWILVQHAPLRGAPIHTTTDHALAFRYDARGLPQGDARDLGAVSQVKETRERIALVELDHGIGAILDGRTVRADEDEP